MLDDRTDHLIRALSGLKSAQQGMRSWPRSGDYPQVLWSEYLLAIDHLQRAGYDVEEFLLPPGSIARNLGQTGGEPMVDGPTLRALVAKAISYFALSEAVEQVARAAQTDPSALIGFQRPVQKRS